MPGPFHGLKVVDLTSVVVGPYATQMLADLGAEVVKVEAPGGDTSRLNGPKRHVGMSAYYMQINRNKRSLALDLKTEEGAAALRKLIADADVFVHNMRPEPLARLGFDYAGVKAIRPEIVYCNIWGFGRDGRYAGRAAYDDVIQAASGLVALEGFGGKPARYVPMLVADKTTGVFAAYAIAAALYHKLATGEGQEIEVPMFEAMTSFVMIENLSGEAFVPPIAPPGSERHATPMRWPYKSANGHVCALPTSDRHYAAVLKLGGREHLMEDPRFANRTARIQHRAEVTAVLEEMIAEQTTEWWIEKLVEAGVPCGQINTLDQVVSDPHLEDVGFWHVATHETEGEIRLMNSPLSFSKTPAEVRSLPPRYGEHTRQVLAELGYSPEQVEAMVQAGAAMEPGESKPA